MGLKKPLKKLFYKRFDLYRKEESDQTQAFYCKTKKHYCHLVRVENLCKLFKFLGTTLIFLYNRSCTNYYQNQLVEISYITDLQIFESSAFSENIEIYFPRLYVLMFFFVLMNWRESMTCQHDTSFTFLL